MNIETSSPERAEGIRKAVKSRYQEVAISPAGHFTCPVGVESALELGYARSWLDLAPAAVVDRFVGVGNPFSICMPEPGDRVLDAGCGCGLDTFIAASMIGVMGRAG
jgi:arsenite methyltransferase